MSRRVALALLLMAPLAAAQEPDDALHLHGRFVDVDGAPVAGGRVTVNGRAHLTSTGRAPSERWTDPAIAVSDADGHFSFFFAPPREHRFDARTEHPAPERVGRSWTELPSRGELELGDTLLEPRAVLVGSADEPSVALSWVAGAEPLQVVLPEPR